MKILILNTDLGYGGAEKMLAFVANTLSENGYDVTFMTYREKNFYQKLNKKVKREHFQLENKGFSIISGLKSVRFIHSYIKKNCFDLAIAFLTPSQLRLVLGCMFTNTKVLLSQRGDPYLSKSARGLKQKLIYKICDWIYEHGDYFVFQTENAKKYYSSKVQESSCIIPNPIEPLKRTEIRDVEKRIVTVSRLDLKQKRQDILIKAFKMFCKEYDGYKLELYGTGSDENIIREMIGKEDNIKLCGLTRDITSSIQNATMFVLTSDYEGIPNALIEAMALGVPCISTKCSPGGAELLIKNMKNGLLVKCGDEKEIYHAMKFMVENPEKAEVIGKNGMKIVDRFSTDIISEMWLCCIKEITK